MGQVVFLALVGLAAYLAWRNFGGGRALPQRRRPDAPQRMRRDEATQLELDPKTGVYRPIDRKDR